MVARQIPASWRYLKARRSNRLEVMSILFRKLFFAGATLPLFARVWRCGGHLDVCGKVRLHSLT
jgi:hypothetical protein